jgi:hypothetical protein
MRRVCQFGALVLLVTSLIWWLAAGAHRGWTQTSVPVKTLDEVTGIEGVDYQKRFVPGVDLLALAALVSGTLAGLSLLVRKSTVHPPHS